MSIPVIRDITPCLEQWEKANLQEPINDGRHLLLSLGLDSHRCWDSEPGWCWTQRWESLQEWNGACDEGGQANIKTSVDKSAEQSIGDPPLHHLRNIPLQPRLLTWISNWQYGLSDQSERTVIMTVCKIGLVSLRCWVLKKQRSSCRTSRVCRSQWSRVMPSESCLGQLLNTAIWGLQMEYDSQLDKLIHNKNNKHINSCKKNSHLRLDHVKDRHGVHLIRAYNVDTHLQNHLRSSTGSMLQSFCFLGRQQFFEI